MSDFGSTLRSIIKVCGVKSYILADALGYDPSYLSKWLNNSKRPPAAMIDGTAEEIAKVCVHSGDTSAFEKLAENYNIQSVDVSDKTACKKMIKSIIVNSFFETERETQPRKKAALPVTCPLNIDLVFEQLMVHIERGADKFDLIIPLNVFKLAVEKKPELLAFFKIGSTERQRVSLRLFYTDSTLEEDDSMEVFILSLTHVFFNSSFQLYYISQADYSKYGGLCVLNDCFAVCGIRDPFSGEALCASISNHESVEKIYHSALSYFYKQTSVLTMQNHTRRRQRSIRISMPLTPPMSIFSVKCSQYTWTARYRSWFSTRSSAQPRQIPTKTSITNMRGQLQYIFLNLCF